MLIRVRMDIGAALKARLDDAMAEARRYATTHSELVQKARSAPAKEKVELKAAINDVRLAWQKQIEKCRRLHQMYSDYVKNG